jgi:hypothetical protein
MVETARELPGRSSFSNRSRKTEQLTEQQPNQQPPVVVHGKCNDDQLRPQSIPCRSAFQTLFKTHPPTPHTPPLPACLPANLFVFSGCTFEFEFNEKDMMIRIQSAVVRSGAALVIALNLLCWADAVQYTDMLLREYPMVLSHDAGTGYLPTEDNIVYNYGKNQNGGLIEQLDCGARALDIRPFRTDAGELKMHHGFRELPYLIFFCRLA